MGTAAAAAVAEGGSGDAEDVAMEASCRIAAIEVGSVAGGAAALACDVGVFTAGEVTIGVSVGMAALASEGCTTEGGCAAEVLAAGGFGGGAVIIAAS